MKKIIFAPFGFVILFAIIIIASEGSNLPKGWFQAGNEIKEYQMGTESKYVENGKTAAYIKSKNPVEGKFGTMMQKIEAKEYLGKRLRISCYIKSIDVKEWAGLWMRVDDVNNQSVSFDNMQNRPIKGTTDWKKYEVVLDVPTNSSTLNYGILLTGKGEILFDNINIEEVDKNVPVTSFQPGNKYPLQPVNLNFED